MTKIHDEEFGDITVRRSVRATSVRISIAPGGTLRASLPPYAPLYLLKRLITSSRSDLRKMLEQRSPAYELKNGMEIGKSHKLTVMNAKKTSIKRYKQNIVVILGPEDSLTDPDIEQQVRTAIIAALRLEAKSYLPNRLKYLAEQLGYDYEKVRFSHASSRWGSCSTSGTISLNIALMKLPFDMIDYVIIHELSHTKQMNHSQQFWALVGDADPKYKMHRKALKNYSPSI